jgi:selenocysteine lyase/cysteine desulfurase
LRGRNDCTIFGIPDGKSQNRVATISFVVEGHDPEQVCQKLDEYKIALRFGDFHARRLVDSMGFSEANGILRVSMTHYNTLAEVDRVIAALDQVLA